MHKLFIIVVLVLISAEAGAQTRSILDENDVVSRRVLTTMSVTGNLKDKQNAEAWVVVSSIALGMGMEQCNFPRSDDMTFMWQPASDGMSEDEILTLNRLVTSKFRNAQRNGHVSLDRLFPVTRQAVLKLSDGKGRWNCREISRVWDAAHSYTSAKTDKPSSPINENTPRPDAQAIRKKYLDCLVEETSKTARRKLSGQDFSFYLKSTCREEEMRYREVLQSRLRDQYSGSRDVMQTTIASEIDKIIGQSQSDFVGIYFDVTTEQRSTK